VTWGARRKNGGQVRRLVAPVAAGFFASEKQTNVDWTDSCLTTIGGDEDGDELPRRGVRKKPAAKTPEQLL